MNCVVGFILLARGPHQLYSGKEEYEAQQGEYDDAPDVAPAVTAFHEEDGRGDEAGDA